jgi:hypothetical protein
VKGCSLAVALATLVLVSAMISSRAFAQGNTLSTDQVEGTDIGDQINQAYANCPQVGCRINIPAGQYSFSTPIVIGAGARNDNKAVDLECDGGSAGFFGFPAFPFAPQAICQLTYTGPGTAISVQACANNGAVLSGFQLVGLSSSGSTVGLQLGGTGNCVGALIQNISITGFGTGLVIGSSNYLNTYQNLNLANNGTNLSYPSDSGNSGEGILFIGGVFQTKSRSIKFPLPLSATCVDLEGPTAINISFYGVSFDNCPITLNGRGLAHYVFTASHFENPNGPLTSTELADGTPLDYISVGPRCGICQVLLNGADIYDWHTATTRAELISLHAGRLTVIGGDYRASASIPQVVRGFGTSGLAVLNAQKMNAASWQGGSINSSLLLDTSVSPAQFQITGGPLWMANYPTLAKLNTSVPSPGVGMLTYCGDCQPKSTSCSASAAENCVCKGSGSGMVVRYENYMGNGNNWYCH